MTTPNDPATIAWLDDLARFGTGCLVNDRYLPHLHIDSDVAWEVIIPRVALASTDLTNVTITPDGIYIENTGGDWDILPFSELAECLAGAGSRNLDERLDMANPRLTIIAKLGDTVLHCSGQPGYAGTGQQRILARLAPADRSL